MIDAPSKVQGNKGKMFIVSCHLHRAPFLSVLGDVVGLR
jgi:hypothetical protein